MKTSVTIYFLIAFLNIKKSILTNLKISGTIFLLIAFSNIKKSIITNLNISGAIFLLIAFSNIKKGILTNLKTPLFILIMIILKETINIKTIIQIMLIKTITQTDKHKAKYIITARIPKLL